MSTSYPFLKIAQRHGVDYGAVLSYATLMHKRFFVDLTCEVTYWEKRSFEFLSADMRDEVRLAMIKEHERQETVQKEMAK